ncbi:hypothetical protein [Anoxynatronum sibiricum]
MTASTLEISLAASLISLAPLRQLPYNGGDAKEPPLWQRGRKGAFS